VRGVQETVRASARPDLEIHWTEWNTQSTDSTANITWGDNVYVDNLFGAGFIARNCIALDGACDTFCYWTASDIFEEGPIPSAPFSATYGLVTIHGIPKAHCNAFRLLSRLRGRVLETQLQDAPPGCGLCATRQGDTTHVLLWNHALVENAERTTWNDTLRMDSGGQELLATLAHVRAGAGSPYESWLDMGRPQNLSPAQEKLLRAHAEPHYTAQQLAASEGAGEIPFTLGPNEILYIEIAPVESGAHASRDADEEFAHWDRLMGEKSR
jgi:xylan 1,4-beta-xylosidase